MKLTAVAMVFAASLAGLATAQDYVFSTLVEVPAGKVGAPARSQAAESGLIH